MNEQADTRQFLGDSARLDALLEKYPWFTTARIMRSAVTGTSDPLLNLNLLVKPWPAGMLHNFENTLINTGGGTVAEPAADPTGELIDRFLASGEKKVVPRDDTPLDDASEGSSVFVPDEEDLDTGELERIYRDQGLELMNDDVAGITGEILGEVAED